MEPRGYYPCLLKVIYTIKYNAYNEQDLDDELVDTSLVCVTAQSLANSAGRRRET